MSPTQAAAGARLRAARELKRRSLRSVARATFYNASYLSRVERGLQRPSVSFLLAVTRELGLDDVAGVLALFVDDEPRKEKT